MIEVRETAIYAKWFAKLADRSAKARIVMRIRRLSLGNFGDAKSVGNGVAELRVDQGPGYRIYFLRNGTAVVVLLAGGGKRSQDRDIAAAKKLARDWNRDDA